MNHLYNKQKGISVENVIYKLINKILAFTLNVFIITF